MKLLRVGHLLSHSIRFSAIILVCGLVFFSNTWTASAFTTSKDNPYTDDEVLQKSAEVLRSGPPSLKTVQERSSQGPNEVQADADLDKMKRPGNSKGTTIQEKIEKTLEKAASEK
jgi:hypothetical protein